jgi:hypothetical protein
MKRRSALLFIATMLSFAQAGRDAYRNAYRAWRQADPTLERDAAIAGPALAAEAERVASEAAKYGAERSAFLTQVAADHAQKLAWLEQKPAEIVDVADGATEVVAASTAAVQRNISIFAKDPDRGIQQLRGMLERENAALASLSSSIAGQRKAADSVGPAAVASEQARLAALTVSLDLATGLRQSAEESTRETAAWVDYYRTLSDGARNGAAAPAAPTPTASAPIERRTSITPLPLARYTGAWTFPAADGLFHGPQPLVVDLEVHEENGRADGTLAARFKVASGDPMVRFNFSGEFKNSRQQVFALETTGGAKGTLELIPGPAFNLLEINFQTEPKPGKISQANFLLVKK